MYFTPFPLCPLSVELRFYHDCNCNYSLVVNCHKQQRHPMYEISGYNLPDTLIGSLHTSLLEIDQVVLSFCFLLCFFFLLPSCLLVLYTFPNGVIGQVLAPPTLSHCFGDWLATSGTRTLPQQWGLRGRQGDTKKVIQICTWWQMHKYAEGRKMIVSGVTM